MNTSADPEKQTEQKHIASHVNTIHSIGYLHTLLETAAEPLLVINDKRQIVALNSFFATALGITDPEKTLGLKFGESLQCRHAFDDADGCGATPYCISCGMMIAMMAAIDENRQCERICALSSNIHGQKKDLCLLVRAQPVVLDNNRFILIYARDISHDQLAASFEHDFMHDLNTMLSSVKSYGDFLHYQSPENELSQRLHQLTDRALKEIRLQNMLKHHSQPKFVTSVEVVKLSSIRNLVLSVVLHREVKCGKHIEEDGPENDFSIATDPVLVSRVIINMLLNALEATGHGECVKLTTRIDKSGVSWQVWNSSYIDEHVQLRIFQKYFSTRSNHGRGLGTHAMKLLGEDYLGGKVSFTSSPAEGTTFTFSLSL